MVFLVLFTCQRSGICCSHPSIVITLTHEDIWRIYDQVHDFEQVKNAVQFLMMRNKEQNEKLVLPTIKTTEGEGNFILRKKENKECIFYDQEQRSCQIHIFRPQACRNFPFAFNNNQGNIIASWVKGSKNFCAGIGYGHEYSLKDLELLGKATMSTLKAFESITKEINKESPPLTPQDALVTLIMSGEKNKEKISNSLEII